MCGLVLLITKNKNGFNQQQNNVFTTLLYLSGHFRGRDGVGVVAINNIGNVKLAKEAYTVDEFIRTKEFAELDRAAFSNGWAMIGHNRSATRGVVSDENSHPFVADDNIILVHNGTFNGDHKKLADTEVDSEAIAHVLTEEGTTEEALRKINAAYALMWYNVAKKEINVVRNAARPLWYMETNDSYIYASEEAFLEFVKKKFSLTTKLNPFEVKEYNLARYWLDDKNDMQIEQSVLDCFYHKHNNYQGGTAQNHIPFQRSASANGVWEGDGFTMHPLACAWGDADAWAAEDNDGFDNALAARQTQKQSTSVPNRETGAIVTKHPPLIQKVIKELGAAADKTTFSSHEMLLKRYQGTNKLRMLASELVEADDYPKTDRFILIGRTLDENRLHAVLPLRGKTLEQVMELSEDAVFEIDYSGITWSRMEGDEQVVGRNMKDWNGVAILHGVNPVPIYTSKSGGSMC